MFVKQDEQPKCAFTLVSSKCYVFCVTLYDRCLMTSLFSGLGDDCSSNYCCLYQIVLNTINPLKYLHSNNKIVDYKAEAINRRRFDEKTAVDKLAAVAILQEYLDFMNRSS
ncbi:hypothetical protein MKX03_027740 [Papaver bracteatum]|nr:hypothetical protein MKX03_027740 [Papaver bracteatum]